MRRLGCSLALLTGLAAYGCGNGSGGAEAAYLEGRDLAGEGRYLEAIAVCRQALAVDSKHLEARLLLCALHLKQGGHELAAEQCERAVRFHPGLAEAHIALGDVYARQRRNDEAAGSYGEALRLAPDRAAAHRKLAMVRADQRPLRRCSRGP